MHTAITRRQFSQFIKLHFSSITYFNNNKKNKAKTNKLNIKDERTNQPIRQLKEIIMRFEILK